MTWNARSFSCCVALPGRRSGSLGTASQGALVTFRCCSVEAAARGVLHHTALQDDPYGMCWQCSFTHRCRTRPVTWPHHTGA